MDRYQGSARATWMVSHSRRMTHVLKAGVEAERLVHERTWAGTGRTRARGGSLGGYVQTTSSFLNERVTLTGGLRYDVQSLEAGTEGQASLTRHLLSPRLGLAAVPGSEFRTKLFAHYGRYRGRVPLGLLDGTVNGEPRRTGLDPELTPTSHHELVVGVEREVLNYLRLSASYLRRRLDSGVTVMASDGRDTVLVVNPGTGLAAALPEARRSYDALVLSANHTFAEGWMGHLSYTASRLRGNHRGPGALPSSASGPLPEDRPHVLRAYGARELRLTRTLTLIPGLSYLGGSGTPVEGTSARTPWVHSLDLHLGAHWRRRPYEEEVSFRLDAFNVFNAQAATRLVPVRYQPPRQLRLGVRYTFD